MLSEMTEEAGFEIQEIICDIIAYGKRYQLLPQNDLNTDLEPPDEPDAVQFYNPADETGAVFLFRGVVPWTERRVIFKGLNPYTRYEVTSADGAISARLTGRQAMSQPIRFQYAKDHPSTLLFIRPVPPSFPFNPREPYPFP